MRRHEWISIFFQLVNSLGICGATISVTTVARRPELTAAIATGEIAYTKLALTLIHTLCVNFRKRVRIDHIINSGEIKKKRVIRRGALPKSTVAKIARIAIHGGVAVALPIPT